MEWVSVKDKEPPKNKVVLFFTGKKEVVYGYYKPEDPPVDNWATETTIWINDDFNTKIATASHWMPLPEPPIGKKS